MSFKIDKDGFIWGYYGAIPEDVVIPEEVDGITVNSFSASLFIGSDIKSIFIPKTIKSLKYQQLYWCHELESVIFDKDSMIERIPERCFAHSFTKNKKVKIVFPDSIKTVDSGAFLGSNINEVVFGKDFTTICEEAFFSSAIETVNFEKATQFKKLSSSAFADCKNLTEIDVSRTALKKIGLCAFSGCSALQNFICNWEQIEKINFHSFAETAITELDLSDFLGVIGEAAFSKSKIESLILNDYIFSISVDAFKDTPIEKMEKLKLPVFSSQIPVDDFLDVGL